MKTLATLGLIVGFAGTLAVGPLGSGAAHAQPSIPQGPPVWCYGEVEDQCRLFLGTAESCQNVAPCLFLANANPALPGRTFDVHFCMGADEFGRCQLFIGTEEACMNVEPCRSINGQLPRLRLAPR